MENELAVMLPPKNCLPRNYSCMAGLFGSLAGSGPRPKEEEEEDGEDACESPDSLVVVDERPRGRECFLKPPPQSPTLRRRCKSLPSPVERARLEIARSRSPGSQKRVRFADSLGLELTAVRHFCDADMPEVPQRILDKLKRVDAARLNHLERFPRIPTAGGGGGCMESQFSNPGELPGFLQRVRGARVALESVSTDEFSLSGLVRVLNVAFEKQVILRYSLDNWHTFCDVAATYVPGSSDGGTDLFAFKVITPPCLDGGGTVQFAVKYSVDGEDFWDNNHGNNYKVRRHRFKISPPREWENGWIHFI